MNLLNWGRLFGHRPAIMTRRSVGFLYTRDAQAIQYRMPAGFVGEVNRTHPVTIEPVTMDPTNPPLLFGVPGVIDATSKLFRRLAAGDTALTDVYGITVRPYPFQQQATTNFGAASIGAGAPTSVAKLDVLRSGYIIAPLNNFAAVPSAKGGTVHIWVAATTTNHVQGGFEAAATGGSTCSLTAGRTTFNGPPDASGNVEIAFNI